MLLQSDSRRTRLLLSRMMPELSTFPQSVGFKNKKNNKVNKAGYKIKGHKDPMSE